MEDKLYQIIPFFFEKQLKFVSNKKYYFKVTKSFLRGRKIIQKTQQIYRHKYILSELLKK